MFNLNDYFIDWSIDYFTRTLPGVCCRVVPGGGLLSQIPEAPGSPELLVEALHPVEAGAGSQGTEQRRVGGQWGPHGAGRLRSGGSEPGQH